jgi:hypothetical protein
MSDQGKFTIHTRILLTDAQRERLFVLLREHSLELPDLLSELLGSFLDHLPGEAEEAAAEPPAAAPDDDALSQEIAERRAELQRLRARATIGGDTAPEWLTRYVGELEQELDRLAARQRGER